MPRARPLVADASRAYDPATCDAGGRRTVVESGVTMSRTGLADVRARRRALTGAAVVMLIAASSVAVIGNGSVLPAGAATDVAVGLNGNEPTAGAVNPLNPQN